VGCFIERGGRPGADQNILRNMIPALKKGKLQPPPSVYTRAIEKKRREEERGGSSQEKKEDWRYGTDFCKGQGPSVGSLGNRSLI